jgi:hypothetical protein
LAFQDYEDLGCVFMHSGLKGITLLLHFILVALSEKECELWVRGLRHLVPDTVAASYPLQVERWLRKEFYSMENSREM